jgi:DNA-binding NarL/FixJ family response regulator
MIDAAAEYSVLACDQQPIAVEGLRWILHRAEGFRFAGGVHTLDAAAELIQSTLPSIVILDKSFGTPALLQWLHQVSIRGSATSPIVWGPAISESEALRFLQAGARGILRRSSDPETLVTCMRAVMRGNTWMEEGIFGQGGRRLEPRQPRLTQRELQVASLVEQGLRNRDIARELGIQTGTVKIHLRHIFEKTGVRGRFSLALNALRDRGFIPAEI